MENRKEVARRSVQQIMGNHQLIIISQLLQIIETMHSIDELFIWLSDMMIQRMDVQVVQFWTMQAYTDRRASSELRTAVWQHTSLPQHIVINQPVAETVGRLLKKQQTVAPQPVGNAFSQYHSKLLTRYNLNYWACHFMSNSILLPPARNDFSHGKVATPLTLVVTVFLQHMPSSRLLPTLSHILEHVIPIAGSHGLLSTTAPTEQEIRQASSQRTEKHPVLTEFIPHHSQARETAKHVLADGLLIQDKNARHLYLEIDGQKNIGELAYVTQLNTQEFYAALCLLLAQKRIQLYESGRQPFDRPRPPKLSLVPRIN